MKDRLVHQEAMMKILCSMLIAASMLSGCISSSDPAPPAKTVVVVPANSGTVVVCQNGTQPPCN
jgi:PBP1b-binding outer membrane lipoprotein LpoB